MIDFEFYPNGKPDLNGNMHFMELLCFDREKENKLVYYRSANCLSNAIVILYDYLNIWTKDGNV